MKSKQPIILGLWIMGLLIYAPKVWAGSEAYGMETLWDTTYSCSEIGGYRWLQEHGTNEEGFNLDEALDSLPADVQAMLDFSGFGPFHPEGAPPECFPGAEPVFLLGRWYCCVEDELGMVCTTPPGEAIFPGLPCDGNEGARVSNVDFSVEKSTCEGEKCTPTGVLPHEVDMGNFTINVNRYYCNANTWLPDCSKHYEGKNECKIEPKWCDFCLDGQNFLQSQPYERPYVKYCPPKVVDSCVHPPNIEPGGCPKPPQPQAEPQPIFASFPLEAIQ